MKATLNLLILTLVLFGLNGAAQAATYYTGTLNSAQEVPTNSSTAVGFGRVTLNDAETQITVSLIFSGLSSNQAASHIHGSAAPGANAPVLFNIGSTGMTSGTFTALTFAVTPAQVANLKNGLFYFNIHSANFPGGEIRGQITVDAPFVSTIANYQEVPRNSSTATGRGNVSLNATGTQIITSLQFSGLSSNQAASHIHGGSRPGVNSPVLFNIGSTGMTSGAFTDLFFSVTPTQVAQLKSGQFYFNIHSANFPGGEIRGQILRRRSTVLDFDGDAKTDYVVARSDTGAGVTNWFVSNSAGGSFGTQFGAASDAVSGRLMGGDFDGDGKDDITVWRTGALAFFYILQTGTNTFRAEQFGTTGDDPRMINDYDGDGRTDPAVWRGGSEAFLYYRASSATNTSGNFTAIQWGTTGDFPNPGDYDGDGKGDICVQRFISGTGAVFFCLNSTGSSRAFNFGLSSDFIAPGDYDGDGRTDIAAVRTVGGNRTWFPLSSLDGSFKSITWGTATALRTPGDFDGDGKTDVAVWQPVSATTAGSPAAYYILPSSNIPFFGVNWGAVGDVNVNAYNVR